MFVARFVAAAFDVVADADLLRDKVVSLCDQKETHFSLPSWR